ncbi:aldehyde dehydrogenase family protein, partial [Luteimonas sp. SMYT11W]
GIAEGSFFAPTLLLCRDGHRNDAVHDVEAFGPVSTIISYNGIDEALELAARGKGSLVSTLVTREPAGGPTVQLDVGTGPAQSRKQGRVLTLTRGPD